LGFNLLGGEYLNLIGLIRSLAVLALSIMTLCYTYKVMVGLGRENLAAGRIFLKEKTLLRVLTGFSLSIFLAFMSNILFCLGMFTPIYREIGRYVADLGLIALLYAIYLLYGVVKK